MLPSRIAGNECAVQNCRSHSCTWYKRISIRSLETNLKAEVAFVSIGQVQPCLYGECIWSYACCCWAAREGAAGRQWKGAAGGSGRVLLGDSGRVLLGGSGRVLLEGGELLSSGKAHLHAVYHMQKVLILKWVEQFLLSKSIHFAYRSCSTQRHAVMSYRVALHSAVYRYMIEEMSRESAFSPVSTDFAVAKCEVFAQSVKKKYGA